MIDGSSVLCVVPARGGSRGIPRKNLRVVGGLPLVTWPIRAAASSQHVDAVICSTDDAEIADAARRAGALVPFDRPANLATDKANSVDLVLHALDSLAAEFGAFDYVVVLEPTSPLTESRDVDAALVRLSSKREHADSVVGVSECGSAHPAFCVSLSANGLVELGQPGSVLTPTRRQDVRPMFFFDGSIYVSDVDTLRRRHSFIHDRTLALEMPRWKSFEIDDPLDLVLVEALLARRKDFSDPE